MTTDLCTRVTYLNPVAERLTGWSLGEASGRLLNEVLPMVGAGRQPIADRATRCLEEGRAIDLEDGAILVRRDGTEVAVRDSTAPIRDVRGATIGVVVVMQDENEKRRIGTRLVYEAAHDQLTGLVNRRDFERRLTLLMSSAADSATTYSLLYLDLDRFKHVNDTGGHLAGDALLRALAPVMSRQLREGDTLARIGGDEFAVLLPHCDRQLATSIAESLRAAIAGFPFVWDGFALPVGASIGVLTVHEAPAGLDDVIRAADTTCYVAKQRGGNRVRVRTWSTAEPQCSTSVIAVARTGRRRDIPEVSMRCRAEAS